MRYFLRLLLPVLVLLIPFTASAASTGPDITAPTVAAVTLSSGMVGTKVSVAVSVSDNVGLSSCELLLDGRIVSNMTISYGKARADYTFTAPGLPSMAVRCFDTAGNSTTGAASVVTVLVAKTDLLSGDLFKLICQANAGVNDPCKAVYYYGKDGKRHAFPNEATYWTWYSAFGNIVLVTPELMQSIPLGSNVTFKPGSSLVRFVNTNTVYAVSKGGVLHAIANETLAQTIFGQDWNKQISVINDVFFGNYTIGDVIDSSRGWDQAATVKSTKTINDNL